MPLTSMIIHVCVEGWAAIVTMERCATTGSLVQPKANVRYIYFKSADGYSAGSCVRFVPNPNGLSEDSQAPVS